MLPTDRLEQISRRYLEINELLCRQDVLSDRDKLFRLNKERSEIEPVVNFFTRYRKVLQDISNNEELLSDPELRALDQDELPRLHAEREKLEAAIQVLMIPADPNEGKNTILEIRAGESGK